MISKKEIRLTHDQLLDELSKLKSIIQQSLKVGSLPSLITNGTLTRLASLLIAQINTNPPTDIHLISFSPPSYEKKGLKSNLYATQLYDDTSGTITSMHWSTNPTSLARLATMFAQGQQLSSFIESNFMHSFFSGNGISEDDYFVSNHTLFVQASLDLKDYRKIQDIECEIEGVAEQHNLISGFNVQLEQPVRLYLHEMANTDNLKQSEVSYDSNIEHLILFSDDLSQVSEIVPPHLPKNLPLSALDVKIFYDATLPQSIKAKYNQAYEDTIPLQIYTLNQDSKTRYFIKLIDTIEFSQENFYKALQSLNVAVAYDYFNLNQTLEVNPNTPGTIHDYKI